MDKFTLELTRSEMLFVHAAVQRERESTRKAIKRGHAAPDDLAVTDGLASRLYGLFFASGKVAGLGVDFGTSPHGLSAESRRTGQETRCSNCPLALADGFDVWGCSAQPVELDGSRDAAAPDSSASAGRSL